MLDDMQRADVVTARNTVRRAAQGEASDLDAAAAMLDRVLKSACPHEPATWHTSTTPSGEQLTTCPVCGVSWFERGEKA